VCDAVFIGWDGHVGLVMLDAMACWFRVLAFQGGLVPKVVCRGLSGSSVTRCEAPVIHDCSPLF